MTFTLAAACLLVARPAYASVADGHIVTSDDLVALVTSTSANATRGHTFTLDADVSIDTSELATSFSRNSPSRVFAGALDGAGHTITVTAANGKASKPLFDLVEGKAGASTGRAQIKDLTLVFEGDARGATLAGSISNTLIDGVTVIFKSVTPANIAGASVASGLVGQVAGGDNSFDENRAFTKIVNVKVTGDAVGSESSAFSAGLLMDNGVGATLIRDSSVDVGEITASGSGSQACGAATEGSQSATVLYNVTVDAGSIAASGPSGMVVASGLVKLAVGLGNCHVNVTGDIVASNDSPSASPYLISSGLAYQCDTKHNDEIGFANTNTTIKVDGKIGASNAGGGISWADGVALYLGIDQTWRGTSVTAGQIKANAASGFAIASGFAYDQNNYYRDSFDTACDGAKVNADVISAECSNGIALVNGFASMIEYPVTNCAVTAGSLSAKGGTAGQSAGFVADIEPEKAPESGAMCDGCNVSVGSVMADGPEGGSFAAGFSADLEDGEGGISGVAVQNCSVTIADELIAKVNGELVPEAAGLFAADNSNGTKLYNNTVTLPRGQASVVELTGDDAGNYVRFTASEASGRAGASDWESDNKVIFSDSRGDGAVTCAFDEGSSHGTLWRLPDVQYGDLSISCAASGDGASADDEFEFTVTLDDASLSGTFGDLVFDGGVATVKLHAGQTATATRLPEGVGYKVSVSAPAGYTVASSEGVEGAIEKDSTAGVKFTLNKKAEPSTPDTPSGPVTPVAPVTPPSSSTDVPSTPGAGGNVSSAGDAAGSKPSATDGAEQLPQTGDMATGGPVPVVVALFSMGAGLAVRRFGSR